MFVKHFIDLENIITTVVRNNLSRQSMSKYVSNGLTISFEASIFF